MQSFFDEFEQHFKVEEILPQSYSPLVLAYIGDAIYDLIIRTYLVKQGNQQVNKLHKQAKTFVKAEAQKDLFYKIESKLSEEELRIFKRGRNAKSQTKAKNASLSDYRTATGLEALFGYLYLKKDLDRIMELVAMGVNDDKTN